MSKLKAAVVGCGAIAREHLASLSELENVDIVGVCDLSAARAQATAERFGIRRWCTNHEELLTEAPPDLLHITTSPVAHFPIARDALSRGLNVICEKPVTTEYADFRTLRDLATNKGCLFVENQQLRFHSSVRRIQELLVSGELGELLEVSIFIGVNTGVGSAYADPNVPHFSSALRGGAVGDFLPHIAYLTQMFIGEVTALRTFWDKRIAGTPLPADEFRGLLKGTRATAHVAFSGNAQPGGFWLTVTGSRMRAEANLFELPRITFRKFRSGEPAVMSLVDGVQESRAALQATIRAFWNKLAGVGSYDGLLEMLARTYAAVETGGPQPIALEEIDQVAQLVDRLTSPEFML